MRRQGGLHLAQLHAEAAHLDLLVGAPHRLHLAVGAVAAQVAGAVQRGRAASPVHGLATKRAAVSSASFR